MYVRFAGHPGLIDFCLFIKELSVGNDEIRVASRFERTEPVGNLQQSGGGCGEGAQCPVGGQTVFHGLANVPEKIGGFLKSIGRKSEVDPRLVDDLSIGRSHLPVLHLFQRHHLRVVGIFNIVGLRKIDGYNEGRTGRFDLAHPLVRVATTPDDVLLPELIANAVSAQHIEFVGHHEEGW